MRPLSIYVHIPFCIRKCAYCDFLSFERCEAKHGPYIGALNKEIDNIPSKFFTGGIFGLHNVENLTFDKINKVYEVKTIYFGGGTPTSVKPEYICDLLCKLKNKFNVCENPEITIEANPGTLTKEKLLM